MHKKNKKFAQTFYALIIALNKKKIKFKDFNYEYRRKDTRYI